MSEILRWLLGLLFFIVLITVINLWPYTTKTSETTDGITTTEYWRHVPLNLHAGGHGSLVDEQVCFDAASVCVRANPVLFSYPRHSPSAPWAMLCEPLSQKWRYFNRVTGAELKCENCSAGALDCTNPLLAVSWIDTNQVAVVQGYEKENYSTLRTYRLGLSVLVMTDLTIQDFVYGTGNRIASAMTDDRRKLTWIGCTDTFCEYYVLDFVSGTLKKEATTCQSDDRLTFVQVDNRLEIRIDAEAKGDEICRDAQGKLAYPLGPEPFRLDPNRIDAPKVEPSVEAPISSQSK